MKTIFLDFDGVLHPTTVGADQMFCRMPLLPQTFRGTDVDIVKSSSWLHHHSIVELRSFFPEQRRRAVVGVTGEPFIGKWPRYQEILNYCNVNGIRDWRALDDSFLEFPKDSKDLILCNPNTGGSETQVNMIKRWLIEKGDL
ncbi:MAG: hypothetical protein K9K38_05530 [Rhodoferax sp.]|nr:hypothetical protein [Rhodoferax sp.]MCF8208852.1 hypothetical protein [Rhodoferax sp.]